MLETGMFLIFNFIFVFGISEKDISSVRGIDELFNLTFLELYCFTFSSLNLPTSPFAVSTLLFFSRAC